MYQLKKTNYNLKAYAKSYTEMRMNVLHKYINIRILLCILTVCFLLCLSGCEESAEGMKIYYRNVTDNTLVAVDFETESTDAYEIISEMFEQMRKKPKQKEIDILLLDGIEIINTEINMNVANIHDIEYMALYNGSKALDALTRLTMLPLDRLHYRPKELNAMIKKFLK